MHGAKLHRQPASRPRSPAHGSGSADTLGSMEKIGCTGDGEQVSPSRQNLSGGNVKFQSKALAFRIIS